MNSWVDASYVAVVCISTALLPAVAVARGGGRRRLLRVQASPGGRLHALRSAGAAHRGAAAAAGLHPRPHPAPNTSPPPQGRLTEAQLRERCRHRLPTPCPPAPQGPLTKAQLREREAPDRVHVVDAPQQALVVLLGAKLEHSAWQARGRRGGGGVKLRIKGKRGPGPAPPAASATRRRRPRSRPAPPPRPLPPTPLPPTPSSPPKRLNCTVALTAMEGSVSASTSCAAKMRRGSCLGGGGGDGGGRGQGEGASGACTHTVNTQIFKTPGRQPRRHSTHPRPSSRRHASPHHPGGPT
jgi:hypothetical protein